MVIDPIRIDDGDEPQPIVDLAVGRRLRSRRENNRDDTNLCLRKNLPLQDSPHIQEIRKVFIFGRAHCAGHEEQDIAMRS